MGDLVHGSLDVQIGCSDRQTAPSGCRARGRNLEINDELLVGKVPKRVLIESDPDERLVSAELRLCRTRGPCGQHAERPRRSIERIEGRRWASVVSAGQVRSCCEAIGAASAVLDAAVNTIG